MLPGDGHCHGRICHHDLTAIGSKLSDTQSLRHHSALDSLCGLASDGDFGHYPMQVDILWSRHGYDDLHIYRLQILNPENLNQAAQATVRDRILDSTTCRFGDVFTMKIHARPYFYDEAISCHDLTPLTQDDA